MVTWNAYSAVDKWPTVTQYDPSVGNQTLSLVLLSGAPVDTNAPTRLQYNGTGTISFSTGSFNQDQLSSLINLHYTSLDKTNNPGSTKRVGATMFLARSDQFAAGVVPTPSQILALGSSNLIIRRSFQYYNLSTAVTGDFPMDLTLPIPGPMATELTPNTKYWVLIMPTIFVPSTTPSIANDALMSGTTADGIGRVVSVWSNRTPTAPTITSPSPGSVVTPGATFTLSFTPADPDKAVGGTTIQYTDLAGVQVQYAPRPTPDNPSPAWIDLPFADAAGTTLGPGWAIKSSTALPANAGAFQLLNNLTASVKAGSNTLTANQGAIPGGDWQIRLRTFDFGNSRPTVDRPLGIDRPAANLKPDLYPALNTSPWSTSVNISVPGQVPPPVPLTPTGNIALPEGQPVTLSYQYRNTAVPPFPQAHRLIQIRKVGDAAWTTLVDEDSASTSLVVTGFTLAATTFYEWRVQATDTDGKISNFSSTAQFWIVSAPASGPERPTPSSTIDGATLGCGKHTIEIFRRGGTRRVGVIRNVTHLDWGRVRDDISTAKVEIMDWDIDCGNLLAKLQTWAYEVVITRDNGYSKDRVWEGPITLLTYERDKVTIQAKDVMGYGYRRIIRQAMNDSGKNTNAGSTVVNRAMRVLMNTFAPDDPNVLAYLQVLDRTDDAKQYRSTPAYSRTAFEEIDDMAANSGLDYTTVGRSILLWGTKHRIGTLPEFNDADLGSPPIVSEYGMSMANVYSVSDGNGIYGVATRGGITETGGVVSGNDPNYGLVEMLSSSWASDSPDDSGTYTQAGLQTLIESFEGYAERSISDRYLPGAPVIVRVPDNTTLNPGTVISIQQLVPGVVIPLRSTGTLRTVVDSQKLDSVKVVEENGEETITITMSPFNRDDTDTTGDTE